MKEISLTTMLEMQKQLHKKYGQDWIKLIPENGHYSVLWMFGEMGEMVDIIKKEGHEAIMSVPETREAFLAEMVDVMMFMLDVMTCYDITPEEFSRSYKTKHLYNMKRWEDSK